MRNETYARVICLAILLSLFYSLTLASLPRKEFNIPSQFGMVKEVFEVTTTPEGTSRTIIHIQDAHCNYEARKTDPNLYFSVLRGEKSQPEKALEIEENK